MAFRVCFLDIGRLDIFPGKNHTDMFLGHKSFGHCPGVFFFWPGTWPVDFRANFADYNHPGMYPTKKKFVLFPGHYIAYPLMDMFPWTLFKWKIFPRDFIPGHIG